MWALLSKDEKLNILDIDVLEVIFEFEKLGMERESDEMEAVHRITDGVSIKLAGSNSFLLVS